ncbi:hypothetical protein FRD00_22180 [Persicimonas caeni]|nr:hypothetical protein FRD00_22180 [Persicimonas caeni]
MWLPSTLTSISSVRPPSCMKNSPDKEEAPRALVRRPDRHTRALGFIAHCTDSVQCAIFPSLRRTIWLGLFIFVGIFLVASAGLLTGCSDAQLAGTAEQRDLGHTVLQRGLEFRLSPGTITGDTETSVEARASAPLPTFSLSSGPSEFDSVSVTLTNVHRHARVRVAQITALDSGEMLGCPTNAERLPITCESAETDPACAAPTLERPETQRSEFELELSQPSCTRVSYNVELSGQPDMPDQPEVPDQPEIPDQQDDAPAPLRFAVLGRTASLDELRRALDRATADDPDLVVLLGDNAENASLNGLRELELVLRRADYPAVVIPGEGEIVEGSRQPFLETFGPFDYRFGLKDVHMLAFYSAEGALGQDGATRLQSTLQRLGTERPRLLFTHTPPIDPVGPRDQGFESQIEGARTLSILTDAGVDALFVGHINDAHSGTINGVQTHLTSVERAGEYLWVEVDAGEVDVERRKL